MDTQYPGLKEYLQKAGFSTHSQTSHLIRTGTDQRGEHKINKDAKISGKYISYGAIPEARTYMVEEK